MYQAKIKKNQKARKRNKAREKKSEKARARNKARTEKGTKPIGVQGGGQTKHDKKDLKPAPLVGLWKGGEWREGVEPFSRNERFHPLSSIARIRNKS